jgi:hypothetical protein
MSAEMNKGEEGSYYHLPGNFQEWRAGMPQEFQQALDNYIRDLAYQQYLQRGGVSTSEQRLSDTLAAEKYLFEHFGLRKNGELPPQSDTNNKEA